MGSYAECWLNDFLVGSSKNDIDPDLISLFRESDKVVLSGPSPELPHHLHHHLNSLEEDDHLRIVYYEAPVDIVRDRLHVMGYSLSTSKQAFREWIRGELGHITESMQNWEMKDSTSKALMVEYYQGEIEVLSALTPDMWIEGLRFIRASGLKPNFHGKYEGPHQDTSIGYMLSHDWYGFPGYDMYVALRLAIETCGAGEKLIYDLTDLIWSDYFDCDENFVEYGLSIPAAEYNSKAKTIVLTEGKSDAWILEQSLRILYPHLQDYFSFLDFEGSSIGGGVGNLANMVKAFAGAGIINNVVALFDNDTAAQAACKALEAVMLPSNAEDRW